MPDYTIRYLRRDGRLSMIYRPRCTSMDEAILKGHRMRPATMDMEVWSDLQCIEAFAGEDRASVPAEDGRSSDAQAV